MDEDISTETLAETDNFSIWISQEPDGEVSHHVELGLVTLHFYDEEWDEFLELIGKLPADKGPGKRPSKR